MKGNFAAAKIQNRVQIIEIRVEKVCIKTTNLLHLYIWCNLVIKLSNYLLIVIFHPTIVGHVIK